MTFAFIISMVMLLVLFFVAKFMIDEVEEDLSNALANLSAMKARVASLETVNKRKTKYIAELEKRLVNQATPDELARILTGLLSAEDGADSGAVRDEGSTKSSGGDDYDLPDDALSDR